MIKLKPCPYCADIGVESFPRVGIVYGMYGLIATCECPNCENQTWSAIDHAHFMPEEVIDQALEKAKREWNNRV